MNIVTGYIGEAHITSQQDRYVNQSSLGTGSYILPIGSKLAATIDSATQVTIADGGVSIQGCVAVIENGMSESLAIQSGTAGMTRKDLICARYTKDSSGVESVNLVVITGTASSGTASDPAYTNGSIEAGDVLVDFPLYRVNVSGITIASVTKLAGEIDPLADVMTDVASLGSRITSEVATLTAGKAYYYNFSTRADMWTAFDNLSSGTVFVFMASGSWAQDVLAGGNYKSWGIGYKWNSEYMHLLCVHQDKLYYARRHRTNAELGDIYIPLNLKTNGGA